jgi:hypothetical protein
MTILEKANDHQRMPKIIIAFIANDLQIGKSRFSYRIFGTMASETESKLVCLMNDLFHCDLHSLSGTNQNNNGFGQWLGG